MNKVNRGPAKFTPGPWTATKECELIYVLGGPNDTQIICEIGSVAEHSSPDQEANARLISAAPELLVWVIELLNQVKRDNPDKMAGIVEHVEKLISRATGEAK